MRPILAILVGTTLLDVGAAYGQENGAWVSGGAGQRGTDFEGSGVLLGVLKPQTPFRVSRADISGVLSIAGGYDHQIGGAAFIGVEASLDVSNVQVGLDPVTSTTAFLRHVDIFQCPPPGIPGPCMIIPGPVWRTVESQTLALHVAEDMGGSLQIKGGYDFGSTTIWISAGFAAQSVEISYNLPALQRVSVPAGFEATTTQLAAESRTEKDTLTGTVIGLGAAYRLSENLSASLTYRRMDYGDLHFVDTVRVTDLRMGAASESGDVSLRWQF